LVRIYEERHAARDGSVNELLYAHALCYRRTRKEGAMRKFLGIYPYAMLLELSKSDTPLSIAELDRRIGKGKLKAYRDYKGRYQVAHRLEENGLICAVVIPPKGGRGGRRQVGYTVTKAGEVVLSHMKLKKR
jgi:hypothetical protein